MRMTSYPLQPKMDPSPARAGKKAEVTRLKDGSGVVVDIKRPDFFEYRWASGANLARTLQSLNSATGFIMITSFRSYDEVDGKLVPRSRSQNDKSFAQIPGQVREKLGTKRIGAYWLVGHWTEKDDRGEVVDSLEYSWLLTRDDPDVTGEQWLRLAIDLTQLYDQSACIIRLDGETTLRRRDGSLLGTLTTARAVEDAWASLAKLRESGEDYSYTELRKMRERGRRQPIVSSEMPPVSSEMPPEVKTSAYRVQGNGQEYQPEFFIAKPHSNSARMHFAADGIAEFALSKTTPSE